MPVYFLKLKIQLQNSNTFELCLSVRPSVRSNHDCVRTQRAKDFKLCKRASIENGLYRFTGAGISHINQTGILGSWVHGTSGSHKILYLGLYII